MKGMDTDARPTPAALLARVREAHATQRAVEVELMGLAVAWADAHPDLDGPDPGDPDVDVLVPLMDWRAGAPFFGGAGSVYDRGGRAGPGRVAAAAPVAKGVGAAAGR